MAPMLLLLACWAVGILATPAPPAHHAPSATEKRMTFLQNVVEDLAKQTMLQQQYVEELIRADGNSGVKQIRNTIGGTRPYFGTTFTNGGTVLSIHDHSNYDRTIGMGEFIGVLNGVEFRTRHNDYKLFRPSKTSKNYHATEPIPFPEVPPAVKNKRTVAEQVTELREWFKAWQAQDHSKRDYRPYFKAALCYLEGAWTLNTKSLKEPFDSDRHHLDADSWFQLQELVRYTSYTGSKSNLENYAYLPTAIYNVTNGVPQFAQWSYRILCHPVEEDLPTKYLELIDDLASRLSRSHNMTLHKKTRAARFRINEFQSDRSTDYSLVDKMMSEIPGADNYPGKLEDHSFGQVYYDVREPYKYRPLRADRYHRFYNAQDPGVKRVQIQHRGFHDETVFMAHTTRPEVVPVSVTRCHNDANQHRICTTETTRVTYAVPIEVVYMTPLLSWNPYDLELKTWGDKSVEANGRNGEATRAKAYNGTKPNLYYRTPQEFFTGGEVNKDPADTARGAVGVLDRHGVVRKVVASGSRIFLPNIPGIGVLRTRYPVAPAHQEGSAIWREMDALKEMVMNMHEYAKYFETPPTLTGAATSPQSSLPDPIRLRMSTTTRTPPGHHNHVINLSPQEVKELTILHKQVTVTSSTDNMHSHEVQIKYDTRTKRYSLTQCDGQANCWDGHTHALTVF